MQFNGLTVGVPKEIMHREGRVAATPETVRKMAAEGATILVETGAGAASLFTDDDYAEAGGELVADVEELFARSHVILKVKEPMFNSSKGKHEIEMMKRG